MRTEIPIALVLGLALAGCAGGSLAARDEPVPGVEVGGHKVVERCFFGEVQAQLPDGAQHPLGSTLVQQLLDRGNRLITEQVVQLSQDKGMPPNRFAAEYRQQSEEPVRFSVRERQFAYTGECHFEGPAWAWTEWRCKTELKDGRRVESHATLEPDGLHWTEQVTRQVTVPNGERGYRVEDVPEANLTYRLAPLELVECRRRLAELDAAGL